jgi:hypothetical protein
MTTVSYDPNHLVWWSPLDGMTYGTVTSDVATFITATESAEPTPCYDCICPAHLLGSAHVPECPWPNRPRD